MKTYKEFITESTKPAVGGDIRIEMDKKVPGEWVVTVDKGKVRIMAPGTHNYSDYRAALTAAGGVASKVRQANPDNRFAAKVMRVKGDGSLTDAY